MRCYHHSKLVTALMGCAFVGVLAGSLTVRATQLQAAEPQSEEAQAEEAQAEDAQVDTDESESDEDHESVWMRMKLKQTQVILEGLTRGDFATVEKNATTMRRLSRLERFVRGRTPAYKTQLEAFQHANERIIQQAQKENLEGTALAYTQLTFSCIQCHQHLRDQETSSDAPEEKSEK